VVYVWALPALSEHGFANRCEGWPKCDCTGASVSNFISNPHATGAMAGCFFYPCLHMWQNALEVRGAWHVKPTLVMFQACFGLFLTCPVTEVSTLHAMSVASFCVASFMHFGALLRHCSAERHRYCKVLLMVSILSFTGVFCLVLISRRDKQFLPDHCPMLFYTTEAVGLTSQAIFPMLWSQERRKTDMPRQSESFLSCESGGLGEAGLCHPASSRGA